MKRLAVLSAALFASLAIAAPASASPARAAQSQNIVEVAAGNPDFSTLVSLVQKAGLAETLSGGEWTVFAPTNAAFAKVPKKTLRKLAKNKKLLTKVLTYHVVKGKVDAATAITLNGKKVRTVNGKKIKITVKGGSVYVNRAKVVTPDVGASNGVIHVIDRVLIPS